MIPTDPAARADYWRRRHDALRLVAEVRRDQAARDAVLADDMVKFTGDHLADRDRERELYQRLLGERDQLLVQWGNQRDRMRTLLSLIAGMGTNSFLPKWLYERITKEVGL